jgi:hypothetical protein
MSSPGPGRQGANTKMMTQFYAANPGLTRAGLMAMGGPAFHTRSKLRAALEAAAGMDPLMQLIVANALIVSKVDETAYGGGRRGRGRRQHGGGVFTAALAELGNAIRAKAGSIVTAIDAGAGAAVARITGASTAQVLGAVGVLASTSTVLFGSPSFPAVSNALLSAIAASPDALMTLLNNTMTGLAGSAAIAGAGIAGVVAAASVAVLVVVSLKFGAGSIAIVTAAGRAAAASIGALYNADLTAKTVSCLEAVGVIRADTPVADAERMVQGVLVTANINRADAGGPPVAGVDAGLGVTVNVVDAATADAQPIETAVVAQIPGTTFKVYGPGAAAWIAERSRPGAAGGGYRKAKKHSRKNHRKSHRKSRRAQRKTKSQRKH